MPISSFLVHPPPIHPTSLFTLLLVHLLPSCSPHFLFTPLPVFSTYCSLYLLSSPHCLCSPTFHRCPLGSSCPGGVLHISDLTCSRKFLWFSLLNLHLALPEEARTCLSSLSPLFSQFVCGCWSGQTLLGRAEPTLYSCLLTASSAQFSKQGLPERFLISKVVPFQREKAPGGSGR